jgi:phosphoribosylanthranilate isomerase
MTFIKICGITCVEDAAAAVAAGADALGFNFYKPSPRYITPETAREIIKQLPRSVLTVGVFVNESQQMIRSVAGETGIAAVQLHGDESPTYCADLATKLLVFKTLAASRDVDIQLAGEYEVEAFLLDTEDRTLRGGTGRVFDWSIARQFKRFIPKLILAGGLSPENIQAAIETVRPYGVDACSSLEDTPGKKNHERMRAFVERARNVKP